MHHPQGILDQDLDHDLPRGPLTPVVKKKKAIPQPFRFYSLVSPCPTRSGSSACANFTLLMSGLPSPSALAFLGGTGLGVLGWGAMLGWAALSSHNLPRLWLPGTKCCRSPQWLRQPKIPACISKRPLLLLSRAPTQQLLYSIGCVTATDRLNWSTYWQGSGMIIVIVYSFNPNKCEGSRGPG